MADADEELLARLEKGRSLAHWRATHRKSDDAADELARGFVTCSTACIRKSDWLVRSGEKEFIIVLPETDEKGARCLARKLSEAFARQELPATNELLGGTIKFNVTAMDPASDGAGAACLRALLRKAGSLKNTDKRHEKKLALSGTANYLSDFESGSVAERGRNWPAT